VRLAGSLRLRLTLWTTAVSTGLMVCYGAFVYLHLRSNLYGELDRQLDEDIETAEGNLAWTAGSGLSWSARGGHAMAFETEVRMPEGALIHRSQGFGAATERRTREDLCRIEGRPVRIAVQRSDARVRHELAELLSVLAIGLPLWIGAAAAGGYLLARRALAPAARMAEEARRITAESLSARLPVADPRDEMGQLGTVFNETLARLETGFDQLRRFTADASHELRTPLTALRAVGEVGLRRPRTPEESREIVGSMLEEVDRLAHLVDRLLTLSRADAGQVALSRERFDLRALAREVVQLMAPLAEERSVAVHVLEGEPAQVAADRAVLRQAVVALLDNALKYAPPGTTVRVVAAGPTLEVTDGGCGIAPEHLPRIFDRFFRVDASRSREAGGPGGSGLGLSIAQWAVRANGGRIEVESTLGKGSTFRIVLPREDSDV